MDTLMRLAGIEQLLLALVSTTVPLALGWREETARLRPLTREVFWTYAGYILCAHVAFGLLSAIAPRLLLDGSALAACVCGFIAAWWGARLTIHFTAFDRSARPDGALFVLAELALVSAFVANTAIYGTAVLMNLRGGA